MVDTASRASRPAGGAFGAPGHRARHVVGGSYVEQADACSATAKPPSKDRGLDKGSFHIRLAGIDPCGAKGSRQVTHDKRTAANPLRLPDEDEAGPQNRMFGESRGSRFRLDADAAASKVVKERQLRTAQRLRLIRHPLQRAIQARHQSRRRFVGHVPQRGDDRWRPRIEKRARQPDDAVAGHCAETRATHRKHDEVRIQLNLVNLTSRQPSIVESVEGRVARATRLVAVPGVEREERLEWIVGAESPHASRSAARCDRRQANGPKLCGVRRRVMSPPPPARAPRLR